MKASKKYNINSPFKLNAYRIMKLSKGYRVDQKIQYYDKCSSFKRLFIEDDTALLNITWKPLKKFKSLKEARKFKNKLWEETEIENEGGIEIE